MDMISQSGRRAALAVCILLSACAAGRLGGDTPAPAGSLYGSFLAARYAASRNDTAVASDYYAKALKAAPGNQQFIAEGFLSSLLSGNPQAVDLAPQLPGNALATMLLGNQAALAGNFDQAAQIFGTLPPDDLAGLIKPLLLAWAAFGQGNEQAALNLLGPHFNSPPFGPVYVLNAALIADAAGDTKDAAQLYGAVNTDQPNLRLAQILTSWDARQGNTAQADAVLDALAATHPDLAIALPALRAQEKQPPIVTPAQGMAEAYLTVAGSLTQPQAGFLRTVFLRLALQLRPDLSAARLLLAGTQTGVDTPSATPSNVDMHNALATLAPIPPSDPLYAPATLQRANLLSGLNQTDQAAALLQGLVAQHKDDPGLLSATGDMLRGANRFADAAPYYTRAIATLGSPPPEAAWSLYFDRGICEDQMGDWPKAEQDMQTALKLSPNQPYVLNYLGYSWALRGENLPQAKKMLQHAVSLDQNDGAVIDSLGYVEMKLGNTSGAVSLLTQAVQMSPDDAEVNGHLGDAFWQAGQKLQAAYQWQRALSLHPDDKLKAELQAKIAQHFGP